MTTKYFGNWTIYGYPGSGKTTFALNYIVEKCKPENCLFVDGDSGKSEAICKALGIKYYNLTDNSKTEVEIVSSFVNFIDSQKKKFEAIVMDVPTILFQAAHSYVTKNDNKFREVLVGTEAIKTSTRWTVARGQFLPSLYQSLLDLSPIVFWLFHEKELKINGVRTGVFVAEADDTLRKAASMIVKLTNTFRSDEALSNSPVGLVVKQSVGAILTDKYKMMYSPLPKRLPTISWASIEKYAETYSPNRKWAQSELPDDTEIEMIKGEITPDVAGALKVWAQKTLAEKENEIKLAILEKADGLAANVMNASKVYEQLKSQFDATDLDVKKVLSIMQGK